MSKDLIVLAPNGRRLKVHCTPDTSILQVLEDVCLKQGISPTDYDLKHHNTILDLSTTIRFSNLPNKATLEIVETERKRQETNITIGLLLDDGDRKTGEFPPNTSLYDLINVLAPNLLSSLQHPCILYMRQEVLGLNALKEKTLRKLGLLTGRAILRLLNKADEPMQANVSAVYRRPIVEKKTNKLELKKDDDTQEPLSNDIAGPSTLENRSTDPIQKFKHEKHLDKLHKDLNQLNDETLDNHKQENNMHHQTLSISNNTDSETSLASQEYLERRLRIEDEVTFVGSHKAIAFMPPEETEDEIDDLPDDFYDLTIEEVRRLYHDLQEQRIALENTPLVSAKKREVDDKQTSIERLQKYQNVVVRIQFPDHLILQGIFIPSNTIDDIAHFVKEHLQNSDKDFHIFTTPMKENLNPEMTLLEAKFVPCVLLHFKWSEGDTYRGPYLKEEIYENKSPSDAASILASKYRAPSRRKRDDADCAKTTNPSSSKNSKVPKWFKK